jgi:hypothetical protein
MLIYQNIYKRAGSFTFSDHLLYYMAKAKFLKLVMSLEVSMLMSMSTKAV